MANKTKKRIMIIDTNMISAIDTAGLLEKSGFEVAMVAKPNMGIVEITKQNMPLDLMVLDNHMEGYDGRSIGINIFKALKIPSFYLCSEPFSPEWVENTKENGYVGHLDKPYRNEKLVTELSKFFGK